MDMIKGMEKAVAAFVTGGAGILVVFGIEISDATVQLAIQLVTVVVNVLAVYVVRNSTKKKAS